MSALVTRRLLPLLSLLLLAVLFFSITTPVLAAIGFNGHNPTFNIGYTDGAHARSYTAAPNMRQSGGSLNAARSSIWVNEEADVYVNFLQDTSGKNVYLVYTTDGSRPTKSNGTVVVGAFSKYAGNDRTWYATIPARPAGTIVEYLFYVSNDTLANGSWRVTPGGGFQTTWSEGDQPGYQYTVTSVHNLTQHTDYTTIQAAVTAANTDDIIQIDPGVYNENVTVDKALTLNGPNAGTPGNATRVTEAVVNGETGIAITVAAANVKLNGVELRGATGVAVNDRAGTVIQNNRFANNQVGVQLQTINGGVTLSGNQVTLTQQVFDGPDSDTTPGNSPGEQTVAVGLSGITGSTTVENNVISAAYYGYLIFGSMVEVRGGTISGVMQGVAVFNTFNSTFAPSTVTVAGTTMNGFTGDYSVFPAGNLHAGVYTFTGGSDAGAKLAVNINNVTIEGTGKPQSDSAAVVAADYSSISSAQTVTVDGGTFSNNKNRGIFARGANAAVLVKNATLANNGADPFGAGGNNGYALVARGGALITIENSQISNPTTQDSSSSYAFHTSQTGSRLIVRGNKITNGTIFQIGSGTTLTAYANNITDFANANLPGAGTVNARHNWWGTYISQPAGVDSDSWDYRLGADVESWGLGTLGGASLTPSGGSGTGVIVNHLRGSTNAPFGKDSDPNANALCSDYYDFFVLNPSGDWTVSVPTDAGTQCDSARSNRYLFQFALTGDKPNVSCSPGDCWSVPPGVTLDGNNLEVTVNADEILQGTPFVAAPASALAVLLADFSATRDASGTTATIAWTTVSELDTLGFHLYRSADGEPEVRITDAMVPATGGVAGASYSLVDAPIDAATTYTYSLEAINTDGSSARVGQVTLEPSTPTAVTLGSVGTQPGTPWALAAAVAGLLLVGAVGLLRRR